MRVKAALTRAHIVGAFEKTGIYPLSRSSMMDGIIGDCPAQATKKTVLLKPTVSIPDRTARIIERSGDNVDAVRVDSINHWMMEEQSLCKKPKREPDEEYVNGSCLMTSDAVFDLCATKSAEKETKMIEKELRAQAKVVKAKKREKKRLDKLVAAQLHERDKIAAALAAEEKRIADAQAKEAKRLAKEQAKVEKRIAATEKKAAIAHTKEEKRSATAQAKEVKRAAAIQAKEEKRLRLPRPKRRNELSLLKLEKRKGYRCSS